MRPWTAVAILAAAAAGGSSHASNRDIGMARGAGEPPSLVYRAVTPCRIADTRLSAAPLVEGMARGFQVRGTGLGLQGGSPAGCGIPDTAQAVWLDFVAVRPRGSGNLRAWGTSGPPPIASILNYAPVTGLAIANAIAVPLCSFGCFTDLQVQADSHGTDLVIDVLGYFQPREISTDLTYTPLPPCRIVNTRVAGGSLAVASPRAFRAVGFGLDDQGGAVFGCNVPRTAEAVLINLVAVDPVGPGDFRAWAYSIFASDPPVASVLNYASVPGTGLNLANAVPVPICVGTNCPNDFRVQADASGSHLVADVFGYFDGRGLGLSYTPVEPCRIADTRRAGGPLVLGSPRSFRVKGPLGDQGGSATDCGIPSDAQSVLVDFVAVRPGGAGVLRAWAYSASVPVASTMNYANVPGLNIAHGIAVPICTAAPMSCPFDLTVQANGAAGTHLVIDVFGYFR